LERFPLLSTYGIPQPSIADRKIISRFGYAGIYFVGWEGDPDGSPIKIGIAENPFERFGNFQCGNWRRLKVHEILYVMSHPHAKDWRPMLNSNNERVGFQYDKWGREFRPVREIEAAVHRLLKSEEAHFSGEWFSGGADHLIAKVKDQITSAFSHEFLTHSSMLRRLKMWKEEAALSEDGKRTMAKAKAA
jgi:hypothetical protein